MKNKKVLSVLLAAAMAATLVAGCGSDDGKDNASGDSGKTGSGDVTLSIVGIKSEIYDQWEAMQEEYTDIAGLKGFEMQVTGDETIYSYMQKAYAAGNETVLAMFDPTNVYDFGEQYAVDLSGESWVKDTDWAISVGDKVASFPFCIEGRGIVYNKTAIEKVTGETFDPKSITSLADFTALCDKLVAGGMKSPAAIAQEDWSLGAHLFTLAYEQQDFTEEGTSAFIHEIVDGTKDFATNERYNSVMDTVDALRKYNIYANDPLYADYDMIASYMADGTIAFWFNGNWAWPNISEYVTDESAEFGIMPLVQDTSADDKANSMISGTATKQIIINNTASEAEQQAAKDFLTWLAEDDAGKSFLVEKANLVSPFNNNTLENSDPLSVSVKQHVADGTMYPTWNRAPGDHLTVVGGAMQKYLADGNRDALASSVVDYWTKNVDKID